MPPRRQPRSVGLTVESLEGRTLLSGSALKVPPQLRAALVGRLGASAIKTDPAGAAAILAALRGGLGREWVSLIRSQVRNLNSVVAQFMSGRLSAYSIAGLTVRTPREQSQFVGQPYDQLLPQAAGAAVFKNNVMELGAIMRGPFRDPNTTYYVFALDRGAGARLGPYFSSRPRITPDALVTLKVGPFGSTFSGTITDMTTGSVQPIASSQMRIRGPVIRVFLNTSQLPSKGAGLANYRFAFWTQTQPGADIANVASFAPESNMIRIGVLKRVSVSR